MPVRSGLLGIALSSQVSGLRSISSGMKSGIAFLALFTSYSGANWLKPCCIISRYESGQVLEEMLPKDGPYFTSKDEAEKAGLDKGVTLLNERYPLELYSIAQGVLFFCASRVKNFVITCF